MTNDNKGRGDKKSIDILVSNISYEKKESSFTFVLLILVYFITIAIISMIGPSRAEVVMLGRKTPISAFAGVFSSIGNICIILLVVFHRKRGFIVSVALLLLQFPHHAYRIIVQNTLSSVPGVFTNIFTIIAIVIIYSENHKIELYQKSMRDQAVTDSLTGLPNRFACTEFMRSLIRNDVKFTIVSIDLNNFKSINDTMGHETGNQVLLEIAKRWKNLVESQEAGSNNLIGRFGGDDFALIIRDYASDREIIDIIQKYKTALEEEITIDNCDYFMTACFGYAEFPTDAKNISSLYSCADSAMHELKQKEHDDHILRFSSGLMKTEQYIELERKIRAALEDGSVMYYLQPQYDMTHKLRGFEALARLKDADGSFISPADFIPAAERAGIIDQLDLCVFRHSMAFLSEALKKTDSDITISINISVRHLMKNNFIDEIKEIIDSCGVAPEHIELEITESIMIDSAEKALQCINTIREMGMQIAIDDFGTGYSSLSYLNKFPANLLKIDKSFIDEMNESASGEKYVAAIISMGHVLNLEVISEGVETTEQLDTLKKIGCDYIQGYVWGRPLPPEEAAKLIS